LEIKTFVRNGLGFSLLGLGAVGLVLPFWPTTPFVLASFACFSTSPKIRSRILQIHFFRENIENYECGNGLSKRTLWISLIWLWGMLLISMIVTNMLWLMILLSLIGITVSILILWI
jgi:hypothetical protein